MKFACWLPDNAGEVLGMCSFRDRILIACENGLYELLHDYETNTYTIQLVMR